MTRRLRRRADPDPLVVAAAGALSRPSARVGAVADDLGGSERHLHRRTWRGIATVRALGVLRANGRLGT